MVKSLTKTSFEVGYSEQIPFIQILGSRVHLVQIPDVLDKMERWIQKGGSTCHHVVVTGMHGLIEGHKDKDFKAILKSADLFVPDGIAPVWVARYVGFPLKKRATGSEVMLEFLKLAEKRGYRSFFYGDTADTLELLSVRLQERFPGLQIAGTFSPPFRPLTHVEDEDVIRMINDSRPDVLWVGLGLPKQEQWIYEHRSRLNVPVAVGVGAAFKFLSGKVKRAPTWIGDHGLEWLWRFLHEPKKLWRRVLIDGPRFLFYVGLEIKGRGL
jgi:N-acetylglucosaminyldiphosphoundecaprenol N-acetyl-beta-D-mannosaminyltransferase